MQVMRFLFKRRFAAVALAVVLGGAVATSVAQARGLYGDLRIEGTHLVGEDGRVVQLVGMSDNGIHWVPWGDCWNDASLDWMRSWGATVIRIPVHPEEYVKDPEGFNAKADAFIDAAIARKMYAIADWHLVGVNPNDLRADAEKFFTHVAQKYGDTGNVIYELSNEPAEMPWSDLKAYSEAMIDVIRRYDPDGIIISGTPAWSSFGRYGPSASPEDVIGNPINKPNIMYAFHFYAATDRQDHVDALDSISQQVPVFVTEWGTQTDSGDGPNDRAMAQNFINVMAKNAVSWTNWKFADHAQSGDVLKGGTCPGGPWDDSVLKEAGQWAKEWIMEAAQRQGTYGVAQSSGGNTTPATDNTGDATQDTGATQHTGTTQNQSTTTSQAACADTRTWYGAVSDIFSKPRDIFAGSARNMTLECTGDGPRLTVGSQEPTDGTTYIWPTAYYTTDGEHFRGTLTLTGPRESTGRWIVGQAHATLPPDAMRNNKDDYVAAYICRYVDNTWKCGCKGHLSQKCSEPEKNIYRWFLMKYRSTVPGATASSGGASASHGTDGADGAAGADGAGSVATSQSQTQQGGGLAAQTGNGSSGYSTDGLEPSGSISIGGGQTVEGKIFDCGGSGIAISVSGSGNVIRDNLFRNCPTAIKLDGASDTLITGNRAEVVGQFALFQGGGNNEVSYNEIVGVGHLNDGLDGYWNNSFVQAIDGGNGLKIIGNRIDNRQHNPENIEDYINVNGSGNNIRIADNIILGYKQGAHSSTGGAIVMDGQTSNVQIVDNHIEDAANYGIGITGAGSGVTISGNTVYLSREHVTSPSIREGNGGGGSFALMIYSYAGHGCTSNPTITGNQFGATQAHVGEFRSDDGASYNPCGVNLGDPGQYIGNRHPDWQPPADLFDGLSDKYFSSRH